MGAIKKDPARYFLLVPTDRTRGNWCTLKPQNSTETIKNFFTVTVFKHWNSCPKWLWRLHTRTYSKPVWIWSWATCYSCPCSELGHWTRHPPPQGIRHLCGNLTRPRPGQDISPWVGIRVRPGEGKQGQTHPWDGQAGLWGQAEAGLGCGHMGGPGLARPMARENCRELETSPAAVTLGQGLTTAGH